MALDLETREQLIDTVRRFVAERLRPLEAQVAEDDAMPDDVLDEMKALDKAGVKLADVDLIELNEAFASQVLAVTREMARRQARYGLETMCIGGGQGLAALFERV